MKAAIHPDYENSKILCNCGNVIATRSTRGDFHIEICANCHPFFTGKQKIMDTAGRIEKFKTRYGTTPAQPAKEEPKKVAAPAGKKEATKENRAAKRAKTGKTKAQSSAPAAASEAEAAPAEAKPE